MQTARSTTVTAAKGQFSSQSVFRSMSFAFFFLASALIAATPASANFDNFVERLWPDARARGVSKTLFDRVFSGMTPDAEVIALSRRQPESIETIGAYMTKRVSDLRIAKGRAMATEWSGTLDRIEQSYGVDRYVVLSIWGNETNFGGYLGGHSVVRALATLAYSGSRSAYFRKELLTALQILAEGHITPEGMVGSWAGAMGHTQFMPSSFKALAVDFTGDGRRDIWTSIPDALASSANYLRRMKWRTGEAWGYEVILPPGFDVSHGVKIGNASIPTWQKLGVARVRGQQFPRASDKARLYLPAGTRGPAFLLLPNFQVIKRYNNSNKYALAVGHLADRIRGGGPFETAWPADQAWNLKATSSSIQIADRSIGDGAQLERVID